VYILASRSFRSSVRAFSASVRPHVFRLRPSARNQLLSVPVRPRVPLRYPSVRASLLLLRFRPSARHHHLFVRPSARLCIYLAFLINIIVNHENNTFSSLGDLIPRPSYPSDHRPCAEKVRSLQFIKIM
jgi:hypothetical protein